MMHSWPDTAKSVLDCFFGNKTRAFLTSTAIVCTLEYMNPGHISDGNKIRFCNLAFAQLLESLACAANGMSI